MPKSVGNHLTRFSRSARQSWERNWNFQHPELKGDPDAPGGAGVQNIASPCNIYQKFGIPMPTQQYEMRRVHRPRSDLVQCQLCETGLFLLTILKSGDIIKNIHPVKFRRRRTSEAGFNWAFNTICSRNTIYSSEF